MIIYFSGTGNTRLCAMQLAEHLEESLHELSPDELRSPASGPVPCGPDDRRIIWAFPTYSWGMPPVVERYILQAQAGAAADATHYMLTTCGDDIGLTDRQWRRAVESRGWRAAEAFSVNMPNTYVLMKGFDVDDPAVAAAKVAAAPERIAAIAEAIASGTPLPDPLTRGSFPALKSRVIYPWFRRFAMSPKPFHATEGCVGCTLCARQCPMANITMRDGRPSWGSQCALCLRCYHICPRHAIAYGTKTTAKGQHSLLFPNS